METSAKIGTNVDQAFKTIATEIMKTQEAPTKDGATNSETTKEQKATADSQLTRQHEKEIEELHAHYQTKIHELNSQIQQLQIQLQQKDTELECPKSNNST